MDTEFNKWANCPLSLSPEEISDPFLVIEDFFSSDEVQGHLKDLRKWRDRVTGQGYYTDAKGNPSSLLFTHQLVMKLIEAASLLNKLGMTTMIEQLVMTDIMKLDEERLSLSYYPQNLDQIEVLNPILVINAFFLSYKLAEYRYQLYEWLTYGLSIRPANEFIDTTDVNAVFENLQKLYSAVWLLHLRKERNLLSKKDQVPHASTNQFSLYELNPLDTAHELDKLRNSVYIIKSKVNSLCGVICLGKKPGNEECIFLLVITSDDEKREACNLSSMLEESCRPEKIFVLIHYASTVLNAVNIGNRFFNRALACPVVYLSGDLLLPQLKQPSQSFNLDLSEANWERWFKQGKEFLAGAEYYRSVQATSAALFSLHQSAECILVAIVKAVLGYRINSHNLLRLLGLTQMFTGNLADIFQLDTDEGRKNFNVLKEAYVNVRYKDFYHVNDISVEALYANVSYLFKTAEGLHRQFLMTTFI